MTSTVASQIEPFELPPALARLRDDARSVAAAFGPRAREIRRYQLDHGEPHPEMWSRFCRRGWPALALPTEHGDNDGGLLGMALVLEAFAEQNIVLWMPVLTSAIGYAISQAGPDHVKDVWLPRISRGETQLGMAATEPNTGHNLFRSSVEIRRDGDHFIVNGLKRVTSGLDVADRALVFGRVPKTTAGEPSRYTTILVDPRSAGARMTELPMGHREGVRQYQLEFDDVRVPQEDVVGIEGQGLLVMWPFTDVERILTAALCLGSASYCITSAVRRSKERVIAGKLPIGAHQAIAHPLASLHARLQSSRLFAYRTAARFGSSAADPNVVAAEANISKLLTSGLVFDAADHALQVFGADAWDERQGWLDTYLDARLARSGPVSNEFALNHIANHVLDLPAHA